MIRFTSLLALFIAGCKPQSGTPAGGPQAPTGGGPTGGDSGPCQLAGEWTGTFTLQVSPEITAKLQALSPDFPRVLAQMQNEVRARFAGTRFGITPGGAVTWGLPNGRTMTISRAGEEFFSMDGNSTTTTRVLSHTATATQIMTAVAAEERTSMFDIAVGGGQAGAYAKTNTKQHSNAHTFRLVVGQMQVELTIEPGAALVGTFTRGGGW